MLVFFRLTTFQAPLSKNVSSKKQLTSARSPKYNGASLGLPVTIRPNGVFRCCWPPVCPKGEALESNRLFPGAGCDGSRPFRPPHNSATISHFAGTPPPKVGAQTGVVKNPSRPPEMAAQSTNDHRSRASRGAGGVCWTNKRHVQHSSLGFAEESKPLHDLNLRHKVPHAWRTSTPTTTCF